MTISKFKLVREAPKKMTKKQTAEYYLSESTTYHSPNSKLSTPCWVVETRQDDSGYNYVPKPIDGGSMILPNIVLDDKIDGFTDSMMMTRHLCHTPCCINPDHLEEGTNAENTQDMIDAGRSLKGALNPKTQGEKHGRATIPEVTAQAILDDSRTGFYSYKGLAAKYQTTYMIAYNISNRKKWKHLPT